VSIKEDASPSISVSSGETAVPLFVARFLPRNPEQKSVITRISSWLDYTTLFDDPAIYSAKVTITSKAPDNQNPEKTTSGEEKKSSSADEENPYIYTIDNIDITAPTVSWALQLYFQNGGGPCYLYPFDNSSPTSLDTLPELIDNVGNITLIACLESDEDYRSKVYRALFSTLDKPKGYFLLADSANGQSPLSKSGHVAVYYPDIVAPLVPQIEDAHVALKAYRDKANQQADTLKKLQSVNPALADRVRRQIESQCPRQLLIPPSVLMAGVYCKTDRERGVWKAPANVVLNGIKGVSKRVTNQQQQTMNQAGINVIRDFSNRGVVVWGARTLDDSDNWRYIPVRRLFDMAQRDIKKAMRPMVFESNNQPTWKRVQTAIEHYLYNLWQQGAMAGNKAEEAYLVRIGKDITMTQDEINQGKMIVQVGIAAVRPAEFIILQFTQDVGL